MYLSVTMDFNMPYDPMMSDVQNGCPVNARGQAALLRQTTYPRGSEGRQACNKIVHCDPAVNVQDTTCPVYQQNGWALTKK